ncbi:MULTISPECIES: FAD-dependent oxidoreductase [unclassified Actinotalea]|uniref:FAD-dependent oxidoreductase n=1 Tax=unclassified Actinotalea TaxID=2638618 RepID=UPI0015F69DCD|nr:MULTISPECIES: FAD-dependent oxidoreductase [unclassified Actinotalea]
MSEVAEPDFDVAVVGAGPAGAVAAYRMASAGLSVVLIERGETPGSKNLSGGVLYGRVLDEVFPGFADEAPVERRITRHVTTFLTPDSAVGIDYSGQGLADPVNAVTVLRAKFDPWLAGKAEEAGAFLMPGVRVDTLLTEPGPDGAPRVVGVQAGDDQLRARVVVAADGVNSFLARSIGLRPKEPTNHMAVGVKAVMALPRQTIEDRFGVTGDQGAAHAIVGDCTLGIGGGGFLYTNTTSLSVGVVLRLDDLVRSGRTSAEVFEHYLQHPGLAPYLRGAEMVEYGAHVVAEGGLAMVGEVATHGMLVVGEAAGLTINSGLTVRGMDLAIGSGLAAADAVVEALAAGDVSREGLAGYRRRLEESFVMKDMRTYGKAPKFLERTGMYGAYGELAASIFHDVFALDGTPRRHLVQTAKAAFSRSPVTLRQLVSDGWAGVRAL